jgi:hypothetical protein
LPETKPLPVVPYCVLVFVPPLRPPSKFEFCRTRRSPPNFRVWLPLTTVTASAKLKLFERK